MIRPRVKFFIIFCCVISFYFTGYAQYQIKHFTTENGLPSNGIKGLQWDDSTGFLWIATEAGVVRYNGISFKTFDINSNPDLGSNRVVFVLKNTTGKIFIGGEKGNLLTVKDNIIATSHKGETTAQYNYNYYNAITASDTLFKKCLKNPWPQDKFSIHITAVVPLADTACVALSLGQLYYYSISTPQPVFITTAPANIKVAFTIAHHLYCLNTTGALFVFDVYGGKYTKATLTDIEGKPFAIQQKNSNLFWQVGMESPVVIQDQNAWALEMETNGNIQCRLIASGIPGNTFFNFVQYKKKEDYLFLGSASKGFYFLHKNQLVARQPAALDINQHNSFYSQVELPDGNIMTNAGTIIGDAGVQHNYNIGEGFLNSVYALNDSLLVYCYGDSIFSYNKKTYSRRLMFRTPVHDNFSLAFSGTHLYFANQKGIGIISDKGTLDFIKYFDEKTGLLLTGLFNMLEIEPGKLALATCEGLLQFDIRTKAIDTLLKLPSVCIRSLHKEGEYIFIGTYGGGFYVMKSGVLKEMPLDINQYLKYTHCFIKDSMGFYWISTNNGLFKVKLADIITAYEKNQPQIYYHYLGKDDGMETTEMNGGCTPCAIRLKNGDFSFPTMDGLLWLNPEKAMLALPSGKIYIDKLLVDGKYYSTANTTIQLPGQVKKLEIIFAVSAWCKKENLYIDYALNNDQWIRVDMASGEPKINFSNLSYGNYNLLIRKMNGFGTNNFSYSSIDFTIATPFYQQWWFRVLAVLAVAAIGYLIFRLRLRGYDIKEKKLSAMVEEKTKDLNLKNIQLEKNDQIKTRLISVINHDIITPLKFMHYAGKALVEKKETIEPEQQLQTISEITQTAKDMEMLSSQILNWIIYQNPNERMQKEEFDLHQSVEMVFAVLKFPARLKNTQLQNNVPANSVIYQYMEPLRVLVYNLVLNGINFTKEGLVTVQCNIAANTLFIQVTDSGMGMTKEQIDNVMSDEKVIAAANVNNKKGTGLGYMIIKDLLKMMSGSLSIKSSKNNGTTVLVSLPLK